MESNQKKLSRVRSPRVHITYDVEVGDAVVKRELPLIVGILADLSGKPKAVLPPIKERSFVVIDRDNFDDVMSGCGIRLAFAVDDVIAGDDGKANLELLFNGIDDFTPLNLVKQIPLTNALYQSRSRLRDFVAKLDGNDPLDGILSEVLADETMQTDLSGVYGEAVEWSAVDPDKLITRMLTEGRMALDESQKPYALELIGEFALSILRDGGQTGAAYACDRMNDKISLIDSQLTRQINLVMHQADFQKLAATWRGLHFLVMNTETGARLKLRVLNVSKADLAKDLQKAVEFDQSALFKKVYEDEFGTYGGDPVSFLVGDYEFGRHPADIELLEIISGVAAAAHAPFISSAYSKLFDMEDFFS
ncbi:MAG: type VI secretion system contractile sheath small subunit, partial [Psychrosphaera sp.]|nr:type VI secretion system contractile sheath small subunit [Psychrosphaera sp.]